MKVNIISLGCSKNLVDTELLLSQLVKNGYEVEVDGENSEAEVAIINTCGFIGDAKEESIDTILQQVELKNKGIVKRLMVMGCLSQRYHLDLKEEIPEVDGFYGKFDWKSILADLGKNYDDSLKNERILTTPSHYAYLKIAEGCNRTCSYCSIPLMTGEYQSREMEDIVAECKELADKGVKELLVIAQDLTYYGIDLYGKSKLAELLEKISDVPGIEWIKLHYAYPAGFPKDILKVIRERDNICKYLDIALQHCSDNMLERMKRGINKENTISLINEIREKVPGIYLRTTLMTGHPGETEKDFEELYEFVKRMKFERLGVFPYSHEDDTYCDKNYKDDIPEEVKRERADKIMEIQQNISADVNNAVIGKTLKMIIDREEEGIYYGRTEYDSPEIDPEIILENAEGLILGNFYQVEIIGSEDFDLYGKVINM
ncbi:MAG: 30S ribosomal protein S12 methylthiotransferase RimO [Odoribacter sp.]|nr:30S ribosomal protein S12 methylthiotransferase RimO [Odoribacter sp.]